MSKDVKSRAITLGKQSKCDSKFINGVEGLLIVDLCRNVTVAEGFNSCVMLQI